LKRLALLALVSCSIDTGTFAGKTCDTDVDCPAPYTCAQARSAARTCELLRGPDVLNTNGDTSVYYCSGPGGGRDIHSVVVDSCVSNCHGANMGYVGVPNNFRLDIYDTIVGFLGAKSEASLMKADVDNGVMPPPNVDGQHYPSSDDKALIAAWATGGALFHPDGVVVQLDCSVDGGATGDGGTHDGGTFDGGNADAGDGGP
jgi:hypothetical protein